MGLSIRHLIYDEEKDDLQIIPSSKFEKLYNRNPSISLKEYSGRKIKYITVVVQLENKKPVFITDMKFHIMKIDQDGMFDIDFINELNLDASRLITVPIFGSPENVIDKSSDFSGKKFRAKYSWIPSPTIENRVKELIFGRVT